MTDQQLADRFQARELPVWRDDTAFHQLLATFGSTLPLRKASGLREARLRKPRRRREPCRVGGTAVGTNEPISRSAQPHQYLPGLRHCPGLEPSACKMVPLSRVTGSTHWT